MVLFALYVLGLSRSDRDVIFYVDFGSGDEGQFFINPNEAYILLALDVMIDSFDGKRIDDSSQDLCLTMGQKYSNTWQLMRTTASTLYD